MAKEKKSSTTKLKGKYIYSIGRRKTAVAKVRLYDGDGQAFINDKKAEEYFNWKPYVQKFKEPLETVGVAKDFDIVADVRGSGLSAQAEAIVHGIARALVKKDEGYKTALKAEGYLTRDSRMKERKKPGLKGARRAPQWSKR